MQAARSPIAVSREDNFSCLTVNRRLFKRSFEVKMHEDYQEPFGVVELTDAKTSRIRRRRC